MQTTSMDTTKKSRSTSMSLERSSTGSSPPRRRHHGLRLETIPLDSKASQEIDSQFEKDEDFKFKRHHRSSGLGQRFDSLQDVKRARRVENFNSSMVINESQQGHHLPYMYYYPAIAPAPTMAPTAIAPAPMGPPPAPAFQSPSASMMPNSSLQPFYQETPQLLPAPSLYPYSFVQRASSRRGRHRREKRRNDEEELPDGDFYKYIGDTSFGKGLQIRQLFQWCIAKSLRDKESQPSSPTDGVNANTIALTIIKELVNDLRCGKINIDWEAEEGDHNDNDEDDMELSALFADDGRAPPPKRKSSKSNRPSIPNVKNIENERNLTELESKIKSIQSEVDEWVHVLDSQELESEWSQIRHFIPQQLRLPQIEKDSNYDNSIYEDLVQRIDKLKLHAHLLESHASTLSELSDKKIHMLSKDFIKINHSREIDAKDLLKELSKTL